MAAELCPPGSKQIFPLHCVPAYPADAMEDEERQKKLAAGKAKVGAQRPWAALGGGDPGRGLGERPGLGAAAGAGAGVWAGIGAAEPPPLAPGGDLMSAPPSGLGSFLPGATQNPLLPRL